MDWESLIWATEMPWAQRYLMLALSRVADADGRLAMSSGLMAEAAHMPASTIRFMLPKMIAGGLLTKDESGILRIVPSNSDGTRQALTVRVRRQIRNLTVRVSPDGTRQAGISAPYKERTSESVSLSSSGITSSPVLENEELGQEGISNTRDAQGELMLTDELVWLTDLRTTPGYDLDAARERRLIQRVEAAAIPAQRLCEAATSIAAKWESYKWSPSNKRGYKRLDLTFFDWAKREGKNGQSQNGRHNGRYRAPGTDIPKAGTPEAHARWPAQSPAELAAADADYEAIRAEIESWTYDLGDPKA